MLIGNGLLNAALIGACALFTAGMPLWLIGLILFLGGMARSMQFTALNSIAFADIPERGMTSANTLFSTAFQLAMGLGVALGAIAWRIGERIAPAADPADPFRLAFVLIALVSLIGVADSALLSTGAGDHVARSKR